MLNLSIAGVLPVQDQEVDLPTSHVPAPAIPPRMADISDDEGGPIIPPRMAQISHDKEGLALHPCRAEMNYYEESLVFPPLTGETEVIQRGPAVPSRRDEMNYYQEAPVVPPRVKVMREVLHPFPCLHPWPPRISTSCNTLSQFPGLERLC